MKNYITKKEWEESTGRKAKGSSFIGEVKWARNYNKCYEASPFTLIDDLRRRIYEEYWEAKRLYDDFFSQPRPERSGRDHRGTQDRAVARMLDS